MLLGEREGVAHFALVIEEPADEGRWATLRAVVGSVPEPDAGFVVHAVALAEWHASHRLLPPLRRRAGGRPWPGTSRSAQRAAASSSRAPTPR